MDRASEFEAQIKAELKAKNAGSTYINAYEEDIHNYENTKYILAQNDFALNPERSEGSHEVFSNTDDDEIQTVHSEGIRSDVAPPPLPPVRYDFT